MPMIGHIYYPDSTPKGVVPHEYAVAINIATLGGSIIGQLGFGLAGDWLGKTITGYDVHLAEPLQVEGKPMVLSLSSLLPLLWVQPWPQPESMGQCHSSDGSSSGDLSWESALEPITR
jgi:hypothetical protein